MEINSFIYKLISQKNSTKINVRCIFKEVFYEYITRKSLDNGYIFIVSVTLVRYYHEAES